MLRKLLKQLLSMNERGYYCPQETSSCKHCKQSFPNKKYHNLEGKHKPTCAVGHASPVLVREGEPMGDTNSDIPTYKTHKHVSRPLSS